MRSLRSPLAAVGIPLLAVAPGLAQERVWERDTLHALEQRDAALQQEFAEAAARPLPAKAAERLQRTRAAYQAGQGHVLALLRQSINGPAPPGPALVREAQGIVARIEATARRKPISADDLPVGAPALFAPALGVASGTTTAVPIGPVPPTLKDAADALPGVVEVYEWVRNAMAPEFYYGVMKGEVQAYLEQAANDADTASVLVQMLRAKGVPARYVRGTVEVRGTTLARLVGTANVEQAVRVLERGGIPHEIVLGGGGVASVKLERVWTEAYLPYANYRGAMRDSQGKVWLPLDAAYKPLAAPSGLDAVADLGFDPQAAWEGYLAGAQARTPLEFVRSRIEQTLETRPGTSYDGVLNRRDFGAEVHGVLPNSLPFTVLSVTERSYDLPGTLEHAIRLTAEREGAALLDVTLPVREVLGRRLTLSYEPATDDDAAAVAAYGSLGATPPYLFEVKPVVRAAGRSIAAGTPIGMGVTFTLRMEFTTPGGTRVVSNTAVAGNTTAIGLGGRQTTGAEEGRGAAAEVLAGLAQGYWQAWNDADDELADLMRVVPLRPTVSACLVSSAVAVEYAGGDPLYPVRYQWKGVLIDADLRASAPVGVDGRGREAPFLLLSALQGSVLEHHVFETRHDIEAVSTAKALGLATSHGIEVHEITSTNLDAVLPGLPFDETVKTEVRDAVARGFLVRIPAQPVSHLAWTGVGYVVQDVTTGEAAYQLQGGHSGGVTAPAVVDFPADLRDALEFRQGEPKQDQGRGVARLQKLQSTDFQIGIVNKRLPRALRVLVTDGDGYPLANTWVTFTMLGGGGALANPQGGTQAEVDVRSNVDGIAEVQLLLGKRTDAIPRFLLPETGEEHATQVGMHLVTVRAELARVDEPFVAFALPDDERDQDGRSWAHLTVRGGTDAGWNANLRVATRLSIGADDPYGNPLSNFPIRFAYRPLPVPISVPGYTSLRDPTNSPGGVLRPRDYERCAATTPVVAKDTCAGEAPEVVVQSSALGAFAYPVLGGSPFSFYYFDIGTVRTPKVLDATYSTVGPVCYGPTRETCGDAGRLPHAWTSAGTRAVLVNALGNLVEAYPPGGTATVGLWTDVVYEKERIVNRRNEEKNEDHFFAESTNEWVREHLDNAQFELKPVTAGTSVGAAGSVGNGAYEAPMTMSPSPLLNTIEWKATIRPKIIPYLRDDSGETPRSEVDPAYVDNSNPAAPRLKQRVTSSYAESFQGTFSLWAARALLSAIDPAPIFLRENHTTAHDSSVRFAIEPAAFAQDLLPLQVVFELRRGTAVVLSANGSSREPDGTFRIPADLPLAEGQYTATLSLLGVAGRTAQTMVSQPVPVEAGVVTLTVDTNNDTVVDDADDEAFRKDSSKAFAFWEADPEPPQEMDTLQDYATVRIRLPTQLRSGDTLALRVPTGRWTLRRKIGTGHSYLKNPSTAAQQLASITDASGQPFGPFGDLWEIPSFLLTAGSNEFLLRCESTPDKRPGCGASKLVLYRGSGAATALIAARRLEIQPLQSWLSVFTARRPGTRAPAAQPIPVEGWATIPNDVRELTVLVHGFNVTQLQALKRFFPPFLKRLYWVGRPVLRRQGDVSTGYAHTVGFVWPGDQGAGLPGQIDELAFFPEDELHALQTGVSLRNLLVSTIDRPSRHRIKVIAHSLGNMVVNSALLLDGMDGVVDTYVMNEAAIPADAFDASYVYSPAEQDDFGAHAAAYGFPDDAVWQTEWNEMSAGRPPVLGPLGQAVPDFSDLAFWRATLQSRINPSLFPKPDYVWRWRQRRNRNGQAGSTPSRGPWRGYFATNLARTRVVNAYNETDRVLGVIWPISQLAQKPNVGPLGAILDNRKIQFWGPLKDAGAEQEYLWRFSGSHANVIRQWAELAHWFPTVANAVGRQFQLGIENHNLTQFGGGAVVLSHSYMTEAPLPTVWGAFEVYRDVLKD